MSGMKLKCPNSEVLVIDDDWDSLVPMTWEEYWCNQWRRWYL